MKKTLLLLLVAFCLSTTYAQAQKIGRVNFQDVMASLSESDSAQVKLEAFYTELSKQLETVNVEYNTKLNDFQKNQSTFSTSILEVRRNELIQFQQKIEQMKQAAETDLAEEQDKLYAPLIKKVKEAIDKVSKTQGLTMTIDPTQLEAVFVYTDNAAMPDVTDATIKLLGGTRKVAPAAANTTPVTPAVR